MPRQNKKRKKRKPFDKYPKTWEIIKAYAFST